MRGARWAFLLKTVPDSYHRGKISFSRERCPDVSLTISIERGAHRGPGKLATAARTLSRTLARTAVRVVRPHRNALANLAHMPLTVAGLACADFAAFHLAHGWGWLATGISLVIAELAVADE